MHSSIDFLNAKKATARKIGKEFLRKIRKYMSVSVTLFHEPQVPALVGQNESLFWCACGWWVSQKASVYKHYNVEEPLVDEQASLCRAKVSTHTTTMRVRFFRNTPFSRFKRRRLKALLDFLLITRQRRVPSGFAKRFAADYTLSIIKTSPRLFRIYEILPASKRKQSVSF